MAKRINWEYSNIKNKVYNKPFDQQPGWRILTNTFKNEKCQGCNKSIKYGQKFLWHIETKAKMHLPEQCKLW